MDLEATVKLWTDSCDRLNDNLEKQARRNAKPIHRPVFGFLQTTAGGSNLQLPTFDAVDSGRAWALLKIGLFGNDGHTVMTGALVDIYKAASPLVIPDFSAEILPGQPVPSVYYFPDEGEYLKYGESIMGLCYSVPANSTITLVATIADYPIEAIEETEI